MQGTDSGKDPQLPGEGGDRGDLWGPQALGTVPLAGLGDSSPRGPRVQSASHSAHGRLEGIAGRLVLCVCFFFFLPFPLFPSPLIVFDARLSVRMFPANGCCCFVNFFCFTLVSVIV